MSPACCRDETHGQEMRLPCVGHYTFTTPYRPMANAIQATCKYTGGEVFDGEYGPYTDAVFVYQGEDVKVFEDKGTDEFDALYELEKGESYTLIENNGSYSLADSEVEKLLGNQSNGQPQNGTPSQPPQEQPHPAEEKDLQQLANKHARLIANTYAFLDKQFAEKGQAINEKPTPAEIQKMAVSAAIEAVR